MEDRGRVLRGRESCFGEELTGMGVADLCTMYLDTWGDCSPGEMDRLDSRNPEAGADGDNEVYVEEAVGVLAVVLGAVSLSGSRSFWKVWVSRWRSRPCCSSTLCFIKSGGWVGASSLKCSVCWI